MTWMLEISTNLNRVETFKSSVPPRWCMGGTTVHRSIKSPSLISSRQINLHPHPPSPTPSTPFLPGLPSRWLSKCQTNKRITVRRCRLLCRLPSRLPLPFSGCAQALCKQTKLVIELHANKLIFACYSRPNKCRLESGGKRGYPAFGNRIGVVIYDRTIRLGRDWPLPAKDQPKSNALSIAVTTTKREKAGDRGKD